MAPGPPPHPGDNSSIELDRALRDTVPVLVNFTLAPQYIAQIEAVNPAVKVLQVYRPTADGAGAQGSMTSPGSDWIAAEGDELDALLTEAQVLLTFRFPADWLDRSPSLRWVQLASAGSDHVLREGLFSRRTELILTTASGVHEVPISEHIVAMVLHFSRGLNRAVRSQAARTWSRYEAGEAYGSTACLIGYGPIARRAAMLLKALGLTVVCVRASLSDQQEGDGAVERFYPVKDLDTVLAGSDYVIVAAPRTPQTEGMIGRRQLEAMKRSAVLLNISRGALVDEPALIDALRAGEIAGAALDVFDTEPLPENSALWYMPNVLITPHVSGSTPHYDTRATDLFCDNLSRYLNGQPLRNVVETSRGY